MTHNYNQALYAGISFPPRKDGNAGFFATSVDMDVIKDSIHCILNTRKGEMPMNPAFGSSAVDTLFDNITQNSQAILCQAIQGDIEAWEPRVTVNSLSAYSQDVNRIIVVNASIILTNQPVTFSYSFPVTSN